MIFCKNLLSLIIQASSTPMRRFASAFNIYFYLPIKKKLCMHTLFFFYWKRHRDILIEKKYTKKDEKSSRQRKLNYRNMHTLSLCGCA